MITTRRGLGQLNLVNLWDVTGDQFEVSSAPMPVIVPADFLNFSQGCQAQEGGITVVAAGSQCQNSVCGSGAPAGTAIVQSADGPSYTVPTISGCILATGASSAAGGLPPSTAGAPCPSGCTECDVNGNCLAYGSGQAPVTQLPGSPTTAQVAATAAPAPTVVTSSGAAPAPGTSANIAPASGASLIPAGWFSGPSMPATTSAPNWFTESMFDSIPNWALLAGGAVALLLLMGMGRK